MTDTQYSNQHRVDIELLYTNPLLNDDVTIENVRAVLALLSALDASDCALGGEGNMGLHLIHEWLRRSLAYTGQTHQIAISRSSSG